MSSLVTRSILFIFLLVAGFWAGWEFLLAFFIFFVATGQYYWEHIFLGFIFDLVFSFPMGLFTVIFSTVLTIAYLSNDFFKADSLFLKGSRSFIFAFIALSIYSAAHFYTFWPSLDGAIKFSTISLAKVLILSLLLVFLSNIIKPLIGIKEISQ